MLAACRRLLAVLLLCLPATLSAAQAGRAAPEFELRGLDGETYTLATLRKRGHVLLVFWSTHCHTCHSLVPRLRNLHRAWRGKGLVLAAIDVGYETRKEVAQYARDNEMDYLVLADDEHKEDVILDYGLKVTPTFVLVAPDGRIVYRGSRLPDVERHLAR